MPFGRDYAHSPLSKKLRRDIIFKSPDWLGNSFSSSLLFFSDRRSSSSYIQPGITLSFFFFFFYLLFIFTTSSEIRFVIFFLGFNICMNLRCGFLFEFNQTFSSVLFFFLDCFSLYMSIFCLYELVNKWVLIERDFYAGSFFLV